MSEQGTASTADPGTPTGQDAGPPRGRRPRVIGREPNFRPPTEILLRYRARVLDPVTACPARGQMVRPTVYVAHRLLVRNAAHVLPSLHDAARVHGLQIVPLPGDEDLARSLPDEPVAVRVDLRPATDEGREAPDAWAVLQTFRARTPESAADVGLDHLLTACAPIEGVPFIGGYGVGGVPFIGGYGTPGGLPFIGGYGTPGGLPFIGGYPVGTASQQYAIPGLGGRTPVTWMGGAPARTQDFTGRRPVVAVLDTAIGEHPWFVDDVVERDPEVDGQVIGLGGDDGTGTSEDPFEGILDADTGHGTFIAGLIHQLCPDAKILGIRVMPTSGAVREGDLLTALWQLVRRQGLAQSAGDQDRIVDIVNLSLGYYHETPQDFAFDSALLGALLALARLGVAVVAAAGNGSTDRLMFPAAFAPFDHSVVQLRKDRIPLVSVGAQNPDKTVALYSNTGPWVSCYRPGANLVSTMSPRTNGSEQAAFEVTLPGYPPRATIDPDSFASGFALWSGTSFAAPVLAGELAATLVAQREKAPLGEVARPQCVDRGWNAITAQVPQLRRPQ